MCSLCDKNDPIAFKWFLENEMDNANTDRAIVKEVNSWYT